MRKPHMNYSFVGKIALVELDGYVVGYVQAERCPSGVGAVWYGHPGNTDRQGKVIEKPNMSCAAVAITKMYIKDGKLPYGVYGEDARKQVEKRFSKIAQ